MELAQTQGFAVKWANATRQVRRTHDWPRHFGQAAEITGQPGTTLI